MVRTVLWEDCFSSAVQGEWEQRDRPWKRLIWWPEPELMKEGQVGQGEAEGKVTAGVTSHERSKLRAWG